MELLSEYILFVAKGLTLTVLILGGLAGILAILFRARHEGREMLQIKHLNQQYERMQRNLLVAMRPKKAISKFFKKADKASHHAQRRERENRAPRRRVFVLNFHGDIVASAVASLREEVTAVLVVAEPQDEVVIRLESLGGVVHAYGLAASQLVRIKDKGIPLTVAVDKVAASGGYMMACVADSLIAAPFAVIGSIGVVSQIPNFNRLLKNHDVDFEQFTAGEYKRTVTMFGETTEAGRAKLQEEVENAHRLFKEFLKTYRNKLDLETVANGEHWFATEAKGLNLVDALQTSDDYLLQASETADLYEVTYVTKQRHWLAQLIGLADKLAYR
jgi:serine protease SohB